MVENYLSWKMFTEIAGTVIGIAVLLFIFIRNRQKLKERYISNAEFREMSTNYIWDYSSNVGNLGFI